MDSPLQGPKSLNFWLTDKVPSFGSVLEIGPGIRPFHKADYANYLCVEPHGEYVKCLKEEGYKVLEDTAISALLHLHGFDTILLLDVIEHMSKEDGERVLELTVDKAKVKVIVFTPLGFVEQSYKDGEKDAWGMNGAYWQTHRSGWLPKEFPEWDIQVDRSYHAPGVGAFGAVFNK